MKQFTLVGILLCFDGLLLSVQSVSLRNSTLYSTVTPSYKDCPQGCRCFSAPLEVSCEYDVREFEAVQWSDQPTVSSIAVHGGLEKIPRVLYSISGLVRVDLSNNYITTITYMGLKNPLTLRRLILADNRISVIHSYALHKLKALNVLDLSGNKLSTWPGETFSLLNNLTTLDLSYNQIKHLPENAFSGLQYLHTLKLSNNYIYSIKDGTFTDLPVLKVVSLNNNKIWTLSEDVIADLRNLSAVDLFENPFDCSCDIKYFHNFLVSHPEKFMNKDAVLCGNPPSMYNHQINELLENQFPCVVPNITYITESQGVLVKSDVALRCVVEGHPKPLMYWTTPWGKVFTHESYLSALETENFTSRSSFEYKFGILPVEEATISVDEEGTLIIQPFHAHLHGTFTCTAANSEGSMNSTVILEGYSAIPNTHIMSLIIGGIASIFTLASALIIGAIKLCVLNFCLCECVRRTVVKLQAAQIVEDHFAEEAARNQENSFDGSEYDGFDDLPPNPPLNSPVGGTSRSSPRKCPTPTAENSERGKAGNIVDTLDEVKLRLERKMEKVRSRYHSMKESGSQYLSSIKDTGSSAASRVKAGVARQMEQVKFGVQSMKEFCGTGDMGNQTVSIVSVDNDNQDQPEVIQMNTYV